jgi:hypothetical protein
MGHFGPRDGIIELVIQSVAPQQLMLRDPPVRARSIN